MSEWPEGMKLRPLTSWPGQMTSRRGRSPFSSTLTATLKMFRTELAGIHGKDVVLQIALSESQFRLDGMPRSGAIPEHPGVILSLITPDGALSFPCDKFNRWEENLRAIVLTMKRLREAAFYGVVRHGEQYAGWKAIEAAPGAFTDARDAYDFIAKVGAADLGDDAVRDVRGLLKRAKRYSHPDMPDGDAETFHRVNEAEEFLKLSGLL